MPILRYFIFVGGSLLALILVANAALPSAPVPEGLTSGGDLPPIRIRSERKLSEMATVGVPEPKMYPARQPIKQKAVVAKPRIYPHPMMVAQQPRGVFS